MSPGAHDTAAKTTDRPGSKRSRQRHTPGGAGLGKDAGQEAQRLAAAILEVLAGLRSPAQAAEALGMSPPRYFQVEARAMQALVASCEARPRGRSKSAEKELADLRRQCERLQREVSRQQTLLRLAQRTIGLPPPRPPVPKPGQKSKKRSRRPVVRALRAAEVLQRHSQPVQNQPAAAPAPTSDKCEEA